MQLAHGHPIFYLAPLHTLLLRVEHRSVQVSLRGGERAGNGERPGDVAGVHGLFAAGVDQHELKTMSQGSGRRVAASPWR